MPGISMCANRECPIREKCYRAMAEPNWRQSWSAFEPNPDGTCDHFMEIWPKREKETG